MKRAVILLGVLIALDIIVTLGGFNGSKGRGLDILLSLQRMEGRLERIEANQLRVIQGLTK